MAKLNALVCMFLMLLCASVCKGDWCVVKFTATDGQMTNFINSVCSKLNCGAISPGGACFDPNILRNHCSYALNLNFRQTGSCPQDIGTTAVTDPSYGKCHYP